MIVETKQNFFFDFYIKTVLCICIQIKVQWKQWSPKMSFSVTANYDQCFNKNFFSINFSIKYFSEVQKLLSARGACNKNLTVQTGSTKHTKKNSKTECEHPVNTDNKYKRKSKRVHQPTNWEANFCHWCKTHQNNIFSEIFHKLSTLDHDQVDFLNFQY